jgi:hypothetical protein
VKGRIKFAGNPWPEGHSVAVFRWLAERRGEDVWFGFHLESANYYAERDVEYDEESEYSSDWEAPIVWGNYHKCTISSDEWHYGGFLACPLAEYCAERIDGLTVQVDPLPLDLDSEYDDRAFHIYLLGHDAVADHRITFERVSNKNLFNIHWRGKIALAYVGDYEPKHSFHAEILGVELPVVANGT